MKKDEIIVKFKFVVNEDSSIKYFGTFILFFFFLRIPKKSNLVDCSKFICDNTSFKA